MHLWTLCRGRVILSVLYLGRWSIKFLSRDIHGESRSLRCLTFVRLKDPEETDSATGTVQMQVEFN